MKFGAAAVRWCGLVSITAAVVAPATAEVWVTGPSHKVLRNERPPAQSAIFDARTATVKLFAARNEFAAFQIVFAGDQKGVNVENFMLKGPGGTALSHVALFREHYIVHKVLSQYSEKERPDDCVAFDNRCKELGAPREFPVQMVPLAATKYGAPFDVADGKNEVVWVDIFVPEDAAPGEYTGSLKAGTTTLNVKLTVWSFALPSVNHFPQWAYIGPEEIAWAFGKPAQKIPEMQGVFDAYFQLAHDHRMVLSEEFCNSVEYVMSPARKYYDHYTGQSFRGPFAAGFGFELVWGETQFFDKWRKEGWLNRAFVYLMDEPGSKEAYEEVLRNGRAVKEKTGGKLMRMVTEQYEPSKPDWPRLDDGVDIFCSGGIPPSQIAEIAKKGKVVWTYNAGHAGAPYTDAPGPALRTHAWCGFVSGARSWFFWEAGYVVDKQCRWRNERRNINADPGRYLTDLWNDPLTFDESRKPAKGGKLYPAAWSIRLNGDGMLIYPGKDAGVDRPLAGFCLKNIRQGAQDFEYLYLLEKAGKKDVALAEAKKLIGDEGASVTSADGQSGKRKFIYKKDAAQWDAARIRLGTVLHAIGDQALREKIVPYNQYPNPVGHPDYYGGARY